MPTFSYVARNEQGARVKGLMEALDARVLADRLAGQGYTVTRIEENRASLEKFNSSLFLTRIRTRDLIDFYLQLGTMLKAGIPLATALADLHGAATHPRIRAALQEVKRCVEEGESLSQAMRRHPHVFPPLACELVESGEAMGRLDEIFIRIAAYSERDEEIATQVKAAMRYPLLVLAAAIAIVAATFVYVLPNFALVFERMNADLPLLTRVVLGIGASVQKHGLATLTAIAALTALAVWLSRRERVAAWLDALRLRLPATGPLERQIVIARFTRTLGLLISSGIPILQALATSARVMENRRLRRAIEEATEEVRRGKPLAEPLQKTGEFPAPVVRIIGVGERTGSLDQLLQQVSEQYDHQIPYAVKRLTTFLEVSMILGMGGLVAFIAFAFLMPMAAILDLV
jgi:type IV pilus assembly protein PilC